MTKDWQAAGWQADAPAILREESGCRKNTAKILGRVWIRLPLFTAPSLSNSHDLLLLPGRVGLSTVRNAHPIY
jgi:hypothetical protein